jgi:hypothetical protein
MLRDAAFVVLLLLKNRHAPKSLLKDGVLQQPLSHCNVSAKT